MNGRIIKLQLSCHARVYLYILIDLYTKAILCSNIYLIKDLNQNCFYNRSIRNQCGERNKTIKEIELISSVEIKNEC